MNFTRPDTDTSVVPVPPVVGGLGITFSVPSLNAGHCGKGTTYPPPQAGHCMSNTNSNGLRTSTGPGYPPPSAGHFVPNSNGPFAMPAVNYNMYPPVSGYPSNTGYPATDGFNPPINEYGRIAGYDYSVNGYDSMNNGFGSTNDTLSPTAKAHDGASTSTTLTGRTSESSVLTRSGGFDGKYNKPGAHGQASPTHVDHSDDEHSMGAKCCIIM